MPNRPRMQAMVSGNCPASRLLLANTSSPVCAQRPASPASTLQSSKTSPLKWLITRAAGTGKAKGVRGRGGLADLMKTWHASQSIESLDDLYRVWEMDV